MLPKCAVCELQFIPTRSDRIYCSIKCAKKRHRSTPEYKEYMRKYLAAWHLKNEGKEKLYRERSKPKDRARTRNWQQSEHGREMRKAWTVRNRDKVLASKRAERIKHMDRYKASGKRWREANPERHKLNICLLCGVKCHRDCKCCNSCAYFVHWVLGLNYKAGETNPSAEVLLYLKPILTMENKRSWEANLTKRQAQHFRRRLLKTLQSQITESLAGPSASSLRA